MLIENNSVNGIFIYTEDSSQVEFEKNDFVISGDCIYICTAENPTNTINNTVSGIDPKDDINHNNFRPYPGSMITSPDDFFKYIEGESNEDKYISSRSLAGILQRFQFGLSMTGIIEDYIDGEGVTSLDLNKVSENPLDNLMLTEELNNGVVKVSPLLSQIVDDPMNSFSVMFGNMDLDSMSVTDYTLILRQYTYKTTNTDFSRIQEIMSPAAGLVYYRSLYWNIKDGFPIDGRLISSWKCTYTYESYLKNKLEVLQDFYQNSATRFNNEVSSIRGAFRFREFNFGAPVDDSTAITRTYDLNISGINSSKYSVLIKEVINNMEHQESIVLVLPSNTSYYSYKVSLIDLPCDVEVTVSGGMVTLVLNNLSCFIVDIYYREVYE